MRFSLLLETADFNRWFCRQSPTATVHTQIIHLITHLLTYPRHTNSRSTHPKQTHILCLCRQNSQSSEETKCFNVQKLSLTLQNENVRRNTIIYMQVCVSRDELSCLQLWSVHVETFREHWVIIIWFNWIFGEINHVADWWKNICMFNSFTFCGNLCTYKYKLCSKHFSSILWAEALGVEYKYWTHTSIQG